MSGTGGDGVFDLSALSVDDLNKLEKDLVNAFDAHYLSNESGSSDDLNAEDKLAKANAFANAAQGLAEQIEAVRAEKVQRVANDLRTRVHSVEDSGDLVEDTEDSSTPEPVPAPEVAVTASAPAPAIAPERAPVPLGEVSRRAPVPAVTTKERTVLVAAADIPGFTLGGEIPDIDALVRAMHGRARSMKNSLGARASYPVASMPREHKFTLDERSTPADINEVLTAATTPESLVAAGGWCAPSEISYDFYDIVCEDGLLDLPTVGVNRGGIRFPISPSFGDLVGDDAIWTWNETQDVAAATGTAQSGTKTCGRVPCAEFDEERLACNGVCLTVGNLTQFAFPELIANHTRLLFAFHAHEMNRQRILRLVAESSAVSPSVTGGSGVIAPVFGALEMQAIDLREKYRMCDNSMLEVVLPRWLRGEMRADWIKRTGVDDPDLADARIAQWFATRYIRVQWVTDWQVGTSGLFGQDSAITAWPTSVDFLMYPAGTFVLGRGLQLDLGVIRDSTLNATNDFTAAWMEECWLIAKVGHESRVVTVPICPSGMTGAASLTACSA